MNNPKPRSWVAEPLIEWTPWKLEGYEEAKQRSERGECINSPSAIPASTSKRQLRSVESLQAELDRVTSGLRAFDNQGPVDTAAGRLGADALRSHYRHTDSQLERYAKLTRRRDVLESQIRKRSAS